MSWKSHFYSCTTEVEEVILVAEWWEWDGSSGDDYMSDNNKVPNSVSQARGSKLSHLILITLQSSPYCFHFRNEEIVAERD